MKLLLIILLLFILLATIIIDKSVNILTIKELKRRARSGHDKKARQIYSMAAYGDSLRILLWSLGATSATLVFVLAVHGSWLVTLIFLVILLWLIRIWQPLTTSSWAWSFSASLAAPVAWLVAHLQPLLSKLPGRYSAQSLHSGVYEKEDLVELLERQDKDPENRIPKLDLLMAKGALTFGDKTIGSVMTPFRKVRLVQKDEQIGPLLMDELHSSGFSRFPVAEDISSDSTNKIVGTLYIKDLIDHKTSGRVSDLMDKKVFFVHETSSLRGALDAFLKTHHHLFIVVNSFEEIVGVLSIEDVLEQILGEKIVDEFDKYDDLREVAASEAQKEHKNHNEAPVASSEE